jgi:diacylglycerol kinase family enzyme
MTTSIAIIWNPTKTDQESLRAALDKALEQASDEGSAPEVTWWETTADDPGQGAARDALAAGADLLVVAGGDGTVRAVAEHLAEASAAADLAIVPLGTGNLLARNLDVPLGDIAAAFAAAMQGDPRPVDVGWVEVDLGHGTERHGFVVMVGFGIDAHMIAETDDDLKDKAGWLAYVESLGRALDASETLQFRISADDHPATVQDGHTLLVGNCGTLQGGLTILPDADPSDGELDYLIVSAKGVGQWAETVKTMVWDNGLKRLISDKESLTSTESVGHGRAKTLEVALPEPRAFEIDGEELGQTRSFAVSLQPSAIRVR